MNEQETDYDDLDAEQAFRVGLLTELSLIRRALEEIAYDDVEESKPAEQPSNEARYECSECDVVVTGRRAAENHAANDHGAPRDGSTWSYLMSEVDA